MIGHHELTINMFAPITVAPLVFEVVGVIVRSRPDAQHCTAFLDAAFIEARSFFRDAPSNESSCEAAGQTAGTCTGECSRERARYDESYTGQYKVRTDRRDAADDRAQRTTDGTTDTGAF